MFIHIYEIIGGVEAVPLEIYTLLTDEGLIGRAHIELYTWNAEFSYLIRYFKI